MFRLVIALIGLLLAMELHSQSFQKVGINGISHSYTGGWNGAGGSFYDWNGDGLDDVTVTQYGDDPKFYLNTFDGFELVDPPYIEDDGDIKAICWVDFDNDGDQDIAATRYTGAFSLYENDGDFNFTDISADAGLPVTDHFTYGHSWADYDRDGDLDWYICNYHFEGGIKNYLFRNNGDGTFTECAEEVGVDDGVNYSFQAVWIDLDFDGWLDLYVINDKDSPNSLYHNNGDGTFSDISAASGSNIVIEAMSNSFSDYDNDGDFDIYITNAVFPNALLSALSPLYFVNQADQAGVTVDQMCWGALFIDCDNNGWSDLYVSTEGSENVLFINDQEGGFYSSESPAVTLNSHTFGVALGDINNDGKGDLLTVDSSPGQSVVWRNIEENDHHYLKVDLEGVISTKDPFGAQIICYSGGIRQMKQLSSMENYLTQSSQYLIFGLGDADIVDSLHIAWPSGWMEKYSSIEADQFIHLREGESLNFDIQYSTDNSLCQGDSLTLSASDWPGYLWSTGETSQSIIIHESGSYSLDLIHETGYHFSVDSMEIEFHQLPQYDVIVEPISCSGENDGAISIIPANPDTEINVSWNNGLDTTALNGLFYGNYIAQISNEHSCSSTINIQLSDPIPLDFSIDLTEPSCYDAGDGSLQAIQLSGNGTMNYWLNGFSGDSLFNGLFADDYYLSIQNEAGCLWEWTGELSSPEELLAVTDTEAEIWGEDGSISWDISGGSPPYQILLNGEEVSESIEGLTNGTYLLEITDAQGCSYSEEMIIEDHTGVESPADFNQVLIFPNPFIDQFSIRFPDSLGTILDFEIYDGLGRLVKNGLVSSGDQIHALELKSGRYILQFDTDKSYTIIKE